MSFLDEEIFLQDNVSKFYEDKRYAKPYSFAYHKWWAKKMLSFLNLRDPILDNGCGPGFMAQFLRGHKVVGLDISREMVKLAQKRYSEVILGNSQNLPFPDSSFQTIINRSILHHLPNPSKGVSEIHRVLKDGGEAIFTETLCSSLSVLPRTLLKKGKHFSRSHRNFREGELKEIIGAKMEIEKVHYFGYLAYFLLGFPDIFDVYRFFPVKSILAPILIKIDEIISRIPFLNRQAWCIMISARKL